MDKRAIASTVADICVNCFPVAELIQFAAQFAVSLIAIFAVAWLVGKLQLGAAPTIEGADHASEIAKGISHGFAARDVVVSGCGQAALLRDAEGRMMVIRRHGSKFVGRELSDGSGVRLDRVCLEITPDTAFGTVRLEIGKQAQHWAASFRHLPDAEAPHA